MRLSQVVVLLLLLLPASASRAAGFAHSENFTVFAPAEPTQETGQALAEDILARAEQYRKEIATYWFGEELPPSVGPTMINVSFTRGEDAALTWAIDSPRRKYHTLYLSTSPDRAAADTLAHEMTHVVLATRFPYPNRLPPWLEEGAASRLDDPSRVNTRRQLLSWFLRTGNWPRLETVLNSETIDGKDQAAYAVAASLTDFLLSVRDKRALFEFGQRAAKSGWDAALKQHYGIRDVSELQKAWQMWSSRPSQTASQRAGSGRTQPDAS
jgi:hypothetical protein